MRKLLWPLVLVAGAVKVAPEVLKRTMAPPRRPQPHHPDDLGLPWEEVALRSVNDTALRGWLIPVRGTAPAVVVLHGWGANSSLMLPLARPLHTAGFHALFLDARNHGRSEHDDFSSMPRFAEDLEVALEWLRVRDDVTQIGVIGHSVGAGAALLAASRNPIPKAVVSASSFAHPGRLMATQGPLSRAPSPIKTGILRTIERTIGHPFDDIAPESTAGRVTAPVLLVHGDADSVVPVDDVRKLAAANPAAEVLIVPGADHASLEAFIDYVDRIIGFLARHLSDDEPPPP